MSLLFCDSFDHYTQQTEIAKKWTISSLVSITTGRNASGISVSGSSTLQKTLGAAKATLYAGCAYKTQAHSNIILGFANVVTNYIGVENVGDGRLRVHTRDGILSSPSTVVINTGVWYYIELRATAAGTSIEYEVRVNESVILAGTISGLTDLSSGGINAYGLTGLYFQGPGGGTACVFDDVYVDDAGYYGDVIIDPLFARLDGDYKEWTPLSGSNHAAMVSEHTPDDDTTYIYSSTVGNRDTFYLDNLAFTGTILAMQGVLYAKKDDAGAGGIKPLFRYLATDTEDSEFFPSITDYLYFLDPRNDLAGNPLTVSLINAMQFGPKKTT